MNIHEVAFGSWGSFGRLSPVTYTVPEIKLYLPCQTWIPFFVVVNFVIIQLQKKQHIYLFRWEWKQKLVQVAMNIQISSNNWIFNFLLYYEDFIMSLYETDGTTSSLHISMSGLHISMLRPPWQHVQASISACSGLHINMFRRILNSGHAHVEIGMLIYRSWTCCQKLDTLIWNSILLYGT